MIGYFGNSESARIVAWWSLVGAVIGGAVTVAAGYSDMWRASLKPETHELVHTHLKVGWVLLVAIVLVAAWPWYLRSQPEHHPGGGFLTVAALVFSLSRCSKAGTAAKWLTRTARV